MGRRTQIDWSAADWTQPPRLIADALGVHRDTVINYAKKHGITIVRERTHESLPALTGGRILLLGAMPDADVAAVWGVSSAGVWCARRRLRIPDFDPAAHPEKPIRTVRGQRQHFRPCVHCGEWFATAPSDKTVTCGPRCQSRHRAYCMTVRDGKWSEAAKARHIERLKDRGRPAALSLGTEAAREEALRAPEQYHEAKVWTVITPSGQRRQIINLRRTLINELGPREGARVSALLKTMQKQMLTGAPAWITRCGWTLASNNRPKS